MNKIIYALLLLLITFFIYGVVTKQSNDQIKKEKRLPCQKKTVTFEKISNKHLIEKAVKALENNNYIIKSRIEQAIYMKSTILNHIDTKKADKILIDTINRYVNKESLSKEKLLIDYYILENDKEDKGKKGTNCKLYAGYLVFEFKFNNKLIYKIQTDFMKNDASDIPERIDCVIKSFTSLLHHSY